jgi:hypothetical protein
MWPQRRKEREGEEGMIVGVLAGTESDFALLLLLMMMAAAGGCAGRRMNDPVEKQITTARHGHVLTNTGVWSPDGRWIVYDVRSDAAGAAFDGERIERVHVETGAVEVLYRAQHGAKCGVVTCDPTEGGGSSSSLARRIRRRSGTMARIAGRGLWCGAAWRRILTRAI